MPDQAVDDRAAGRRSRHGCIGCRARRKKCDETQPSCNACLERGQECVYPKLKARATPSQLAIRKIAPSEPKLEVAAPKAALFENEQYLLQHFSEALTRLLSFRSDGVNNAFCLHLLPLVKSSSVVLGVVETISTAHLHMLGTKALTEAGDMHSKSLRLLASHLSSGAQDDPSMEAALTTTLMMVYYEVILGDSAENALCHLQGAKALLEQFATACSPQSSARFAFLMKIFHYFDVMIALSLRKVPLGLPYSPDSSVGNIDEIFGLSAGLWPAMHLVAQILAGKESNIANQEMPLQARGLVDQLSEPYSLVAPDPETANSQSIVDLEALVQISNAYRASILLVLHHEVLDTDDENTLNCVYRQALDALLRIAALDGPMATYSTSVWPLFTVGRYAQSSSDRTILRHIFSKISRRHHMKIVDTAGQSISQLWQTGINDIRNSSPQVFFA